MAKSVDSPTGIVSVEQTGAVEVIEIEEGIELKVHASRDDALDSGLSHAVVEVIFGGGKTRIAECRNTTTKTHFQCKQDRKCSRTCIIKSAKWDGSDEQTEEPDKDGKVPLIPGRIYWCPCE